LSRVFFFNTGCLKYRRLGELFNESQKISWDPFDNSQKPWSILRSAYVLSLGVACGMV